MGEPEESTESDSTDPALRRVGMTLSGKWKLEKLLGVGGMAAVYAGRHRNGARAAIKYFSLSVGAGQELSKRFMREGYLANKIEHPSVVRVLDDHIDIEKEHAYIVMELLEGESLQDHVERAGLLSPKRTAEFAIELCQCLAVAHEKGVVHRDIKPDNLFLDGSGLRVLDFGIARALDSSEGAVTRTGSAVGTPAYMAPEQAMGKKEISPRTDIYAVGATMLYLLTGRYLHDVDNAQEMLVNVAWTEPKKVGPRFDRLPEALALIIDRACAFTPEDRFASAEELEAALSAIVADLPDLPLARISKRSVEFSAAPTVDAGSAKTGGAKADVSADADGVPEAPNSGARAVTPRDAEPTQAAPQVVAAPLRRRALLAAVGVLLVAGATIAWWSQRQAAVPDGARKERALEVPAAAAVVGRSAVDKRESTPDILPAPVEIAASASAVASQTAAAPRKGAPAATTEETRVKARPAAPASAKPAASPQLPTPKSPEPPKPKERDIGY